MGYFLIVYFVALCGGVLARGRVDNTLVWIGTRLCQNNYASFLLGHYVFFARVGTLVPWVDVEPGQGVTVVWVANIIYIR